ncbi:MAG: histidine kinase [Gemmatimonadaceae bacterium]
MALVPLAVCTLIGLLFSGQLYLMQPDGGWTRALVLSMPQWVVWGLLFPLIARSDRRLGAALGPRQRVLLHLPLAIGWTIVALGVRFAIRPILHGSFPPSLLRFMAERFPWDVLIYAAIAAVSVVGDYAARARRGEREASDLALRAARLEAGLAEARLHALTGQLQPHFLFNALNAISAFTEHDPRKARRLMSQLGDLLRASLDHAARAEVTLAQELAFLDSYLGIERARFEDRLTVTVQADDAALGALMPAFLLQPLVENAIKHGIVRRAARGRVEVSARIDGDALSLRVLDDGVGLPEGWRMDREAGVGLRNAAERLERLHPGAHVFHVADAAGGGVVVDVRIPFRAAPVADLTEARPDSRELSAAAMATGASS